MANQSYYIKGYCEGWDCVGHCVDDEDVHIVRKPSGTELQLCSSCLSDYRKDYPAPNTACTGLAGSPASPSQSTLEGFTAPEAGDTPAASQ